MKTRIVTLFFGGIAALSVLPSSFADAGVGSTGGGYAVVCREAKGEISRAELLDLYEAVHQYGLSLKQPAGSVLDETVRLTAEIRRLADDSRPVNSQDVTKINEDLKRTFFFLPKGVKLDPVGDVGQTLELPPGCSIEQLAVYRDDQNRVYVDSEIWNALDSSLHRGGLVAHEILYRDYRGAGDFTSEAARRLVGRLFSTSPLTPISEGVPKDVVHCSGGKMNLHGDGQNAGWASSVVFDLFKDPSNPERSILQFYWLFGRIPYSATRISINSNVRVDLLRLGMLNPDDATSLALFVMDPKANESGTYKIGDGIFQGYRISVRYQYGKPFSLALVSPDGVGVASGLIESCEKSPRPLN